MFLEAIFSLAAGILVLDMLRVTRVVTLYHHLHHLPLLIDSIIDTEVILKSSLRDEQGPIADEKMCVVPGLDDELLTLLVVVKEAVAETQVGEVAFRDG